VLALFRVLKKPLTKELEETIHGAGFLFLMVLIVLITIVDVQRFY
jgi:membrane-associated protease RseP (regulator of RpoE activity)